MVDSKEPWILAAFCQSIKTLLQETHLTHIVMEVQCKCHTIDDSDDSNYVVKIWKLIIENCPSVTKFEILNSDGCFREQELDSICRMTTLKQLTISQLMGGGMKTLKYLENLMELHIFQPIKFLDDDLIDIAQNCPKLVKFIYETGHKRCKKIGCFAIKAFVQECCSKDCIKHVEIYIDHLKDIDYTDWEDLVQMVKDSLPKIVIFKINEKILETYVESSE
jgi:hypothetical protein